jgi:hypothetical protein
MRNINSQCSNTEFLVLMGLLLTAIFSVVKLQCNSSFGSSDIDITVLTVGWYWKIDDSKERL